MADPCSLPDAYSSIAYSLSGKCLSIDNVEMSTRKCWSVWSERHFIVVGNWMICWMNKYRSVNYHLRHRSLTLPAIHAALPGSLRQKSFLPESTIQSWGRCAIRYIILLPCSCMLFAFVRMMGVRQCSGRIFLFDYPFTIIPLAYAPPVSKNTFCCSKFSHSSHFLFLRKDLKKLKSLT